MYLAWSWWKPRHTWLFGFFVLSVLISKRISIVGGFVCTYEEKAERRLITSTLVYCVKTCVIWWWKHKPLKGLFFLIKKQKKKVLISGDQAFQARKAICTFFQQQVRVVHCGPVCHRRITLHTQNTSSTFWGIPGIYLAADSWKNYSIYCTVILCRKDHGQD